MSEIETIFQNPGLYHIGKNVLTRLDMKSLLNCREVSNSLRDFIDTQIKALDLKRDYNAIFEHKARRGKTVLDVHKHWAPVFDYVRNDAGTYEFKVFVIFMNKFARCFADPMDMSSQLCPLTMAHYQNNLEVMRVFFKISNPITLLEDRAWLPDGILKDLFEHKEFIGFDIAPDEVLTFVICRSWQFLEDHAPKEHENLIKDVLNYCKLKLDNFQNKRARKDGNTPLHYLQVSTAQIRGLNCRIFTKNALRLLFQFYIDHGFDLKAKNDLGKTPWEIEEQPLPIEFLGYGLDSVHELPNDYIEVLKEFGLK